MELQEYFIPLRRWWWLLLVSTLVAGFSSYLVTSQQQPVYRALTTLIIGRTIDDPNPNSGEFVLSQQLAAAYADIASREPVRNATMESLGLDWIPAYVARALPNSQLIEIQVTDTNPARAQAVANELANQLILRSPTGSGQEDLERQIFLEQELDDLQMQITDTRDEIRKLQEQLGAETSARRISEIQNQITALQAKLTTLQSNFAALLSNTQQGATNTLDVIEPADLPRTPVGPNTSTTILLAAAIGLALAATGAYLLEYLDKTVKTPEEISRLIGVQVIGYIPEIQEGRTERPYLAENPRSIVAEAFRSLRTNLEFAAVGKPLKTLFVTSAGPSVGKTSMAVNMAIIMAQGGKNVILVDADLRRPNIHGFLGISNSEGLSEVFDGLVELEDALAPWEDGKIKVITGGSPPATPAEMLGSARMDQLLARLEEISDIVILDGPPFLVADASVLASKVDGVLLVVRPGFTHKDAARSMMEQIQRVGANIVGIAFNRIPRGRADYYGKYWYYSPAYSSSYLSLEEAALQSENHRGISRNGKDGLQGLWRRLTRSQPEGRVPAGERKAADRPVRRTDTQVLKSPDEKKTDELDPAGAELSPPKALAVLRWQDSVGKKQKLVLREGDTILIGRDRINDVILHSRHVSRRHAVITWRKSVYEIADLGSTNGTKINGTLIERPYTLNNGDIVQLFDVELTFETLKSRERSPSPTRQARSGTE